VGATDTTTNLDGSSLQVLYTANKKKKEKKEKKTFPEKKMTQSSEIQFL